jgi:hypothetical protein
VKVWVVTAVYGKKEVNHKVIGVFKEKRTDKQISDYGIKYSKKCGSLSRVEQKQYTVRGIK